MELEACLIAVALAMSLWLRPWRMLSRQALDKEGPSEPSPLVTPLLATAKTPDQIDGLLEEIVDRFGKLPPQAQTLIDVHRLRVLSQPYGVVKVDAAPGVINITFKPQPPVDPMRIIELIQKNKHIKLAGNEKLRIERELKEPKDRAQLVRDILRGLGQPLAQPALG